MDRIRVGNASVDFSRLTIEGDAGLFSIEPKVLDVLQVLLAKPGEVVSRDDLIDQVWGVSYGGDERLSRAVSLLRKALGDDPRSNRYIETISKRGYRLVADIAHAENGVMPVADAKDEAAGPAASRKPRAGMLAAILAALVVVAGLAAASQGWLSRAGGNAAEQGQPYRNSIAILPFTDLTERGQQQSLATGMTEEILNAITKVQDLHVVGQASSFRYRGNDADFGKIGADLNVRYLLTGSLRMQDRRIRVATQLVEVDDRRVVWSDTYEGTTDRIFQFQEQIARTIARELGVTIAAKDRLLPKMTANEDAYELFVQGRDLSRRFGSENKRTSIRLLEQAIRLDPEFAQAWAWLANTKLLLAISEEPKSARQLMREARAAVSRALSIDPGLAMGHYLEATLHDYDLDFAASMDSIERAYAAEPNQPYLMIRRGGYYAELGQIDKAETMIEEGLRRDPTDAAGLLSLARVKLMQGEFEPARQLAQRSRDLGFEPSGTVVCAALADLGKVGEGRACWLRLPQVIRDRFDPPLGGGAMWDQFTRAVFDRDEQARRIVLERYRGHFALPDPKANNYLVESHIGLRAPELFMQRMVEFPYYANGAAISALWLPGDAALVRRHPAFPAFAERIGLVRAWEKYGWPDKCRKTSNAAGGTIGFSCN